MLAARAVGSFPSRVFRAKKKILRPIE